MIFEIRGIRPDPSKDQHFLTNPKTIKRIVALSKPKSRDRILEVGAGIGTLTKKLAETKAKVTAVEMDKKLRKSLDKLTYPNLKILYENVLDVIDSISFNKAVSNTPYSICEPLINKLLRKDFEIAVLSVPEKFYMRISSRPGEKYYSILTLKTKSSFKIDLKFRIPRKDFSPEPRTETVVITLKPLSAKDYKKDPGKFILKEVFLREKMKLKNSLMESLITFNKNILGKNFTKNMARDVIDKTGLDNELLGKKTKEMKLNDFKKLEEKLTSFS